MIKEIRINGYKKFNNSYKVEFKDGLNILVGDNESGKSTIIEAIEIALNNKLPFKELSALKYYFNRNRIQEYFANPSIDSLPKIYIEIDFEIGDEENIQFQKFYGARFLDNISKNNYNDKKFGIMFECIPDMDYENEIEEYIQDGIIPYEYYILTTKTYGDVVLKSKMKKPVKTYTLDNTKSLDAYTLNKYSTDLFGALMSEEEQKNIKSIFYKINDNLFVDELNINEGQKFNLLLENTNFSKFISVLDEEILLELKGKGKERILLTDLILKKNNNVDVFMIEEPEMNLSHLNLNSLITKISEKYLENEDNNLKQMIITTHSNAVARKLELNNIIYIGENGGQKFNELDSATSKYFLRLDNNNVVDVLNAKKNIIVEGASEYILLPELFKRYVKSNTEEGDVRRTLSDYGINITSGQGITHEHYKNLLEIRGNKTIFITDNDKKRERIFNLDMEKKFNVISQNTVHDWTFEVALYNINKDKIKEIMGVENDGRVVNTYAGEIQDSKTLAYMLNNKTESAFKLIDHVDELVIPDYIKEGFEWIKN